MLFVAAAKSTSSSSAFIFIYIALFVALYFFFIRPRSKKAKAQRLEARKVEVGERAQTVGGLVGTVVRQTSEFVTLRTESGTELDFIPSAIARRYDPRPVTDEALEVHADHEEERPAEGDAE
jgi:preprotein translocase subunit YajC